MSRDGARAQALPDPTVVDRVVDLLTRSKRVLFITGAGLSADSGLPTYRGVGGLYEGGGTAEGIPIEVALSGRMLARDPALCWKYIAQIEAACRGAKHNRAHEIIAQLEDRLDHACVLTQNVDGFHGDAGTRNLIEIHGNIRHLECTRCTWRSEVPNYAELTIPPSCPTCGSLVRPSVVLFGEMLPQRPIMALHRERTLGFDLVFSIGTTSVFPYIADPVLDAAWRGIPTVEINPGHTEVSHKVDHRLRCGAKAAFEVIWRALQSKG